MAELPLEPQLAAALLKAGALGCSSEVAAIAAMLSVRSIWYGAPRSAQLRQARMRFAVAEGTARRLRRVNGCCCVFGALIKCLQRDGRHMSFCHGRSRVQGT